MKHTTKLSAISLGIFILPFVMSLPSYAANTITDTAQITADTVSRQDGFVETKADQMMNPYGLSDKALQSISQSVGWRRLLLFQDTPVEHDNSSIDNPKFFLAQNGRHDAHANLSPHYPPCKEAIVMRYAALLHGRTF